MENPNDLLDDLSELNESLEPQESIAEREAKDLSKLKTFLLVFFVIGVVLSFLGHYGLDYCSSLEEGKQSNIIVIAFVLCMMVFVGVNYVLITKKIMELFFRTAFIRKFSHLSSGIFIFDMGILWGYGVWVGGMIFFVVALVFSFFVEITKFITVFGLILSARWCVLHITFLILLGISFGFMYKQGKDEIINYHKGVLKSMLEKLKEPMDKSLVKDLSKLKKIQLAFFAAGILLVFLGHYIGFYFLSQQEGVNMLITISVMLFVAVTYVLVIEKVLNALFHPIYISKLLRPYDDDSFLDWLKTIAGMLILGWIVLAVCMVLMVVLMEVSAASTFTFKLEFNLSWCMDATFLIIVMIGLVFTQHVEERDIKMYHELYKQKDV